MKIFTAPQHPINFAADSPDKIIAALLGRYFSFLGTCQGKPLHLAAQDRSVA